MVQTAFRGAAAPPRATAVTDISVAPQLSAGATTLDTSARLDPVELLDSDASLSDSLNWPEPTSPFDPICEVIGSSSGEQLAATPGGEVLSRDADMRFSDTFHFQSLDEPEATHIESETDLFERPARLTNREGDLEQYSEPSGFEQPMADMGSRFDDSIEGKEENSIHDWDHSKHHWPILVGPARTKSFSRMRAAMVGLTLLGSAAVFYFLVYQPMTRGGGKATPAPSATSDRAATGAESGAAPARTDAQKSESARPEEAQSAPIPKPEQTAAVNEDSSKMDTRGRFSLQAAAFPTQAGADEFAEKLKRAGLASYVVSADMGRRGTWFRVRVGRFESAEAAKQYSAEALLRAKAAAGISPQLIVCQYEQQ